MLLLHPQTACQYIWQHLAHLLQLSLLVVVVVAAVVVVSCWYLWPFSQLDCWALPPAYLPRPSLCSQRHGSGSWKGRTRCLVKIWSLLMGKCGAQFPLWQIGPQGSQTPGSGSWRRKIHYLVMFFGTLDICHFFYTDRILGSQIVHPNTVGEEKPDPWSRVGHVASNITGWH